MSDSSSDGAPAATAETSDPEQDGSSPHRGLFSRLFDALTPPETEAAADQRLGTATRQVLPGIANLRRMRVADVAIPKAEIVGVPADIGREGLLEVIRDSGFSRLPVYDETLDRPMGFLLLKDLVLRQGFNLKEGDLDIVPMLRPLLFVPPSMPLAVLLQKMRTQRTHMALVIDEYGGVAGLVTIEDLIEQVVGEIDDEHDTEDENLWTEEAPGVWQVHPRAMLDDLDKALGVTLREGAVAEDDDVDTLGGLVFLMVGRVPPRGEVIAHPAGHEIEVLDADPRHVKRLRVRLRGEGTAPAVLRTPETPA